MLLAWHASVQTKAYHQFLSCRRTKAAKVEPAVELLASFYSQVSVEGQ